MRDVAMLTNFERLREIIKTRKPERLEAFDAYIHKKKAAVHPDDDLWMILELIEFHSEIAADIPERLLAASETITSKAAMVEEASASVQNETAKILAVVTSLADELPKRFDSQAVARSIGARIQDEEIGPLLTASNAIANATTNLNTATQRAQKAHCAIERSASIVPWVISAITCALIAVAASAIIIQSERVSIRREFSEQFQSLPEVYRNLAKQGRTLQLVDSPDGTQQLVLSGKADSAFVVNDRAVMQFR
jgi:hypothetical protein